MTDHRLQAPATLRNREPILDVLRGVLRSIWSLCSKSPAAPGQHAVYFAQHLPHLTFQPSDPDAAALQSIPAWTHDAGVTNVLPPLTLDAASNNWPITTADAIICINMIHISPWRSSEGLIQGAARLLRPGSPLYLYGPYRRADVVTAPSNEAFDESLKSRDPEWGLRDLEAVARLADSARLFSPCGYGDAREQSERGLSAQLKLPRLTAPSPACRRRIQSA